MLKAHELESFGEMSSEKIVCAFVYASNDRSNFGRTHFYCGLDCNPRQDNRQLAGAHEQSLVLVEQYPSPVITVKSPGAEGNKYGFEGGNVVKVRGTYHLVTTEMTGEPFSVKTKLAHWSSTDRVHWKRVATLFESSGELPGRIRERRCGGRCLSMTNRPKNGI